MAPAMSMRCMTVPPRMNPSGLASLGSTTCTMSVALSAGRLAGSVMRRAARERVGRPSIPAVAVDERLQRAAQLDREVVVVDRSEERDGGLIGLELGHAAWTRRQVAFEIGVDLGRQVALDEVREQ